MEQRSLDWYRARIGIVTGSNVGILFKPGKRKDELFGDTAKSYLYQIAGERGMNPAILEDDGNFEYYLEQTSVNSRAVRWGEENEDAARNLYSKTTGREVMETGSVRHKTLPFASSPDGMCENGCIEIKCPSQKMFMQFRSEVKDNGTLLIVNPEYFFQCQAHMMCTGAEWCDFIVYNPFQLKPIHIVRIAPDESAFSNIENRVIAAEEFIRRISNSI